MVSNRVEIFNPSPANKITLTNMVLVNSEILFSFIKALTLFGGIFHFAIKSGGDSEKE